MSDAFPSAPAPPLSLSPSAKASITVLYCNKQGYAKNNKTKKKTDDLLSYAAITLSLYVLRDGPSEQYSPSLLVALYPILAICNFLYLKKKKKLYKMI